MEHDTHDQQELRQQRATRQRKQPERYGSFAGASAALQLSSDQCSPEESLVSDDSPTEPGAGSASYADGDKQQQGLKRSNTQTAGHANQPLSKRQKVTTRAPALHSDGRLHQMVVLPDGSKRVEVDADVQPKSQAFRVPKAFAEACFYQFPVHLQTRVVVDGVLQESRASCRVAQYGRGGKHGTFAHVCAKYKQYRVNRLEMNSGCSHLTMHLKSPATRQKAIAEEAAAAQAEAMAAAAAHATGATHWYEHMGSGQVVHCSWPEHLKMTVPLDLIRKAFGTSLASPFEVQLILYKDNQLLNHTSKNICQSEGRWRFRVNRVVQSQLGGCRVVKYRAAAPNMIQVYFCSVQPHNQVCRPPAATGTSDALNPAIIGDQPGLPPVAAPVTQAAPGQRSVEGSVQQTAVGWQAELPETSPASASTAEPEAASTHVAAAGVPAAMATATHGALHSADSRSGAAAAADMSCAVQTPAAPTAATPVGAQAKPSVLAPKLTAQLVLSPAPLAAPPAVAPALNVPSPKQDIGTDLLESGANLQQPASTSKAVKQLPAGTGDAVAAVDSKHATGSAAAAAEVKPTVLDASPTAQLGSKLAEIHTPAAPLAALTVTALMVPIPKQAGQDLPAAVADQQAAATSTEVKQQPADPACGMHQGNINVVRRNRVAGGGSRTQAPAAPHTSAAVKAETAAAAAAAAGTKEVMLPEQNVFGGHPARAGTVVVKIEQQAPEQQQQHQQHQHQQAAAEAVQFIDLVDSDSDENDAPHSKLQVAGAATAPQQQQQMQPAGSAAKVMPAKAVVAALGAAAPPPTCTAATSPTDPAVKGKVSADLDLLCLSHAGDTTQPLVAAAGENVRPLEAGRHAAELKPPWPAGTASGDSSHQQQQQQQQQQCTNGLHVTAAQLVATTAAAAEQVPAIGGVAAASVQDSTLTRQLGIGLQPFTDLVQAFEQLVLLLRQSLAPDELIDSLQAAMPAMLAAECADTNCRRVRVMKIQYSIVQMWVERGKSDKALNAVRMLLEEAAGG